MIKANVFTCVINLHITITLLHTLLFIIKLDTNVFTSVMYLQYIPTLLMWIDLHFQAKKYYDKKLSMYILERTSNSKSLFYKAYKSIWLNKCCEWQLTCHLITSIFFLVLYKFLLHLPDNWQVNCWGFFTLSHLHCVHNQFLIISWD